MQADALIGTHTHLQGGWCVSFLVKHSCSSIRLCDEASLMWSQSEAANPLTASMATVHFPPLFSNYRLGEAPPPPALLRQGPLLLTQMNSSSGLKWNWDSAGRRSRLAVKKRATPQEDKANFGGKLSAGPAALCVPWFTRLPGTEDRNSAGIRFHLNSNSSKVLCSFSKPLWLPSHC